MALVALECTRCGAKLPVAAAPVVTCKYCGTEHARDEDDPGAHGVTRADRSEDTRAPVTITFVSQRSGAVDLVWLDFAGRPVSYGHVPPAGERLFNTYVGHVWSLRDAATGAELLRWAARDQVPRRVPVR